MARTPMCTHSPKVVDQDVEDAQNHDEHNGAPLGLESHHDHDAGHKTNDNHDNASKAPFAGEDKANEQEDEQHSASQLEIHLPVLLVKCRQARWSKSLPNPAVGKDHDETTHDREIAEEEVEVKDQAVSEGLRDHNTNESAYCVFRVLAGDDEN